MKPNAPRPVVYYINKQGFCPYRDWLSSIQDNKTLSILSEKIRRLRRGQLGQYKRLGPVFELKVDVGPGYRIYFGITKENFLVLLGGTKRRQDQDIRLACRIWKDLGL